MKLGKPTPSGSGNPFPLPLDPSFFGNCMFGQESCAFASPSKVLPTPCGLLPTFSPAAVLVERDVDLTNGKIVRSPLENLKLLAGSMSERNRGKFVPEYNRVPEMKVKGSWTREEDERLELLVMQYGPRRWSKIASFLPGRIGKQCRERWSNHLDRSVNIQKFTAKEDMIVAALHCELGNQWALISQRLAEAGYPGRTANTVKNHWNSTLARVVKDLEARKVTPEQYSEDMFIYKCRKRKRPKSARDARGPAAKRHRVGVWTEEELMMASAQYASPDTSFQSEQIEVPALVESHYPKYGGDEADSSSSSVCSDGHNASFAFGDFPTTNVALPIDDAFGDDSTDSSCVDSDEEEDPIWVHGLGVENCDTNDIPIGMNKGFSLCFSNSDLFVQCGQ